MRRVLLGLRLFLAAVFLYAGLVKASASSQFAIALIPFTFLPSSWIGPMSQVLPFVEILGAVLIVIPITRSAGALTLLALCVIFIAALGWALANDIIVACSCFGIDETPSAGKMLIALLRDVALAGMAVMILCENRLLRPPSRTPGNSQKTPGSASD